ncbi:LpxI family protein [Pseudovibrio sp. SPO723]|uniref:LpxI family protein n=1 Tax=Nesiotobacter zosterae TaxID=392721 RepID=UPI0029C309A7|nr:UDP-2,3-diacylglucosamine diphosphatase LpxI [Pseudovibrio sp. SPO723]MDX5592739.1 UDP-2,3-diacylglucosamine diphosphatase LpxI [Pseudovibrio sp. SPO723]
MTAQRPIAVVAGGGRLPEQVIRSAKNSGREVVTIAIKGEADASLSAFQPVELGWGQIGKLFDTIKRAGAEEVILIGSVTRRPDFTSIIGDLGTMRRLPRILAALVGGDDSLLVKVMGIFEGEGLKVVGAHELAPELLAKPGLMAGPTPDEGDLSSISLCLEAVNALGGLDIGQGAVAVGSRVVALEGAEGTDAMLVRCAELRENGRVRAKGAAGVLVKCSKPQQDLRVDLPTVGPQTIRGAHKAQLKGVAVEAEHVLIADLEETLALCKELGIFLFGIDRGREASR